MTKYHTVLSIGIMVLLTIATGVYFHNCFKSSSTSEIITEIQTPLVGSVTTIGNKDLICVKEDLKYQGEKQTGECSFQYFYKVIGGEQIISHTITLRVGKLFFLNGDIFRFEGESNGTFIFTKEGETNP